MGIGEKYLHIIKKRFKHVKEQGDKTFEQLAEKDINWAPNEFSNSIAVIVKHLHGNMLSRWTEFLTTDGEKGNRNRDQEFMDTIESKQEMIHKWTEGWGVLFAALCELTEKDLKKHVMIRAEPLLVIDAIERQLAHYSAHVGQIVYIGKQLKGDKWKNLSIPKGASKEYLQYMKDKYEGGGG